VQKIDDDETRRFLTKEQKHESKQENSQQVKQNQVVSYIFQCLLIHNRYYQNDHEKENDLTL
jgi:hypothetical protein